MIWDTTKCFPSLIIGLNDHFDGLWRMDVANILGYAKITIQIITDLMKDGLPLWCSLLRIFQIMFVHFDILR